MKRITGISAERLRECLDYDQDTGVFIWKISRQSVHIGKEAGAKDSKGYLLIGVDGILYRAHRLAWLHFYGVWPSVDVDHINRVKHDNRIANLREATPSQNQQNISIKKNNKSGYRGVCWNARLEKWVAQICAHGKRRHLGCFTSAESAYEAYLAAAKTLHTHNPLAHQGDG